jgi:hypothetical protein
MQETSPNLQDGKPKNTLTSVLSKLGLDLIYPQPELARIKTNEAEEASIQNSNHEADSGAGTPAFDASYFLTLYP